MTEKDLHNEYRKSGCKTFIDFLVNKIADIKANCDLAIEGRDIKIRELEQKLEQTEKDLADYQFNYPTIKELEQENNKLLDVINNQDVKIADLEKQIEKMKCCRNCTNYTWNMSNKKCQFRCESREACDNWEIKEND